MGDGMNDEFDDSEFDDSGKLNLTPGTAISALAIGVLGGALIGYVAHALFTEPEVVIPPPEVIQDEISEEDLIALCEELTEPEKAQVVAAHERVTSLQAALADREAELASLKAKTEKNAGRRAAAAQRWQEMEQEIASLHIQLAEAESEREELRVELKQTLRDLDRQIAQTSKFKRKAKRYKQESTQNLWAAFTNNAKVQICDRGTRKRHAKCHEAVDSVMDTKQREHFTLCVDTYQAVPVLKKADKGEPLPAYAEWLPDDNKFTRNGWYISHCDPTLPEAKDWDLEDAPAPSNNRSTWEDLPRDDDKGSTPEMSEDDLFNLDDFDDLDLE
jgi:hypothetical protein